MMDTDPEKDFPWARIHSLKYPVQLDALAAVLAHIRGARSRADRPEPRALGERLIGDSVDTQLVRKLIGQVAPSLATVLITGESGTGKEVVARQIHELSGREGPFVAVNCGAIPESLLESELFGHDKGAFTGAVSARVGRFEQAKGGTFFLDEIGDMPTVMQVKLLRVLEERVIERVGGTKSIPVDVRLIAATHRDLPKRIETGEFREDLFYRLSVFPIEITPLSERPDDIPPLVDEFIKRMNNEQSTSIRLSDEAMAALKSYSWDGNVRELANLIERLVVIKPSGLVNREDLLWPTIEHEGRSAELPEIVGHSLTPTLAGASSALPDDGIDLKRYLSKIEREIILHALEETGGVVQKAADLLGIGRTTLVEKIRRHGINASQSQSGL